MNNIDKSEDILIGINKSMLASFESYELSELNADKKYARNPND